MKSYPYLLAAASLAATATAADITWDITPGTVGVGDALITGGAGTWNTVVTNGTWTVDNGANNIAWDNTVNAADTAVFSGTGGTVTLGTPIAAGGLKFANAGYTLSGSTLTFGSALGSINTSALGTGSNQTTISSNLIGTGGLTIAANGDLSASGGGSTGRLNITGDNTGLTGGIAITGGLVSYGSSSAAGSAATTAGSGNALTLSNGGGLLASANLMLGNNVSLDTTGSTFRVFGSQTLTLNGTLSGAGGFNKTDNGTLLLANITQSFTGVANVQAGTLRLGNIATGQNFSFAGSAINVSSGATLSMQGTSSGSGTQNYNFSNANALVSVNGGALSFSQTNNTTQNFNSALSFSGNSTVSMAASAFSTHIVNFGRAITGSGTLTFSTSGAGTGRAYTIGSTGNNYTGSVVLSNTAAAASVLNVNNTLGVADLTINNANWTVNLSNTTHTFKSLNGTGGAIRGNGAASVLDIGSGNNANDSFAGSLGQNGANTLSVIKSGTGITILTGTNNYTGTTTVNGGKLLFNGNSSAATGTATVASGATIGGSGSYGGALNITGTLAPGSSIESFSSGSLLFNDGSTFAVELDSATPNADLMVSSGTLDLTGTVTLSLTEVTSGTLTAGNKLTLINYAGLWNGGLFAGLADDSVFTLGANQWLINYNDTIGGGNFSTEQTGQNFVTITVVDPVPVPEPSIALLGGLGVFALLRRRRN